MGAEQPAADYRSPEIGGESFFVESGFCNSKATSEAVESGKDYCNWE